MKLYHIFLLSDFLLIIIQSVYLSLGIDNWTSPDFLAPSPSVINSSSPKLLPWWGDFYLYISLLDTLISNLVSVSFAIVLDSRIFYLFFSTSFFRREAPSPSNISISIASGNSCSPCVTGSGLLLYVSSAGLFFLNEGGLIPATAVSRNILLTYSEAALLRAIFSSW